MTLDLKGLEYELVPVVPINLPAEFYELSPLGKVPAFEDDGLALADSFVICEYLEDKYPSPAVYPMDPADKAKARWLEEYGDTKLLSVLGPPLFFEVVIKPEFLKQETDQARVDDNLANDIPPVMDYLEKSAPREGFMFGDFGMADITLGTSFLNATYSKFEVDAPRWPALAAYVDRVLGHEAFAKRREADEALMSGG